jgi:hypothetical protein
VAWLSLPPQSRAIDLVGLLRAGGITVCTPPDAPIISTTIQLDGDVINYIDPDQLSDALARGVDATAIVLQHQKAMTARIAPLADTAAWIIGLPWSIAGLVPAGLWLGAGLLRGFDLAGQWRALVLTPLVAVVLRFAPRWIISPMIRRASRRFGAPPT